MQVSVLEPGEETAKDMMMAYKFRIYPNKQQEAVLDVTLETCRCLYNEALS